MLDGFAHPEFSRVAASFTEGFDAGRDVGASIAVVRGGELVVDLWGGFKDRKASEAWTEDTLVCCFSISKAITTTCVLQAVDAGLIDLDEPITTYWPEFSTHGKKDITSRDVLSHQSGVVGFHAPTPRGIYYDWAEVCDALANESPWWAPRSAHGYHARTFGFLLGEVLRRASGITVGSWLSDRIAGPAGLDVHIGLTDADVRRCADMIPARVKPGESSAQSEAERRFVAQMRDPDSATWATFQNPNMGPGYMNKAEFRRAEMPALNGHGTARAIARFFAMIPELVSGDLLREATSTASRGEDRILCTPTHFGLGYMLHDDEAPIGRPGCFGHAGAGGSVGFYDPERDLAFAFVMNQMQEGVVSGGTSATRCVDAVYESLS
jgi:CubicO group peptidase (beta-lactamase class C family)